MFVNDDVLMVPKLRNLARLTQLIHWALSIQISARSRVVNAGVGWVPNVAYSTR
jgi:hypothetical protein